MRKLALAVFLAGAVPTWAQDAVAPQSALPTETQTSTAAPLSDTAIQDFVRTHTAPSAMIGKIPRWARPICVRTQGLPKELGEAVTNRLKSVIAEIGAPLDKDPSCALNAAIFFDPRPQEVLDDIAKRAPELLGYHEVSQAAKVATIRHPVQAWYATQTRDLRGNLLADAPDPPVLCDTSDSNVMQDGGGGLSGMPRVDPAKFARVLREKAQYCGTRHTTGNRVRSGLTSEFSTVTVVASTDALNYHQLAPVADYIALLMLSQTQAFDSCKEMDSIANLLVRGCDVANRLRGLTLGDKAYLKALYRADPDGLLAMQQQAIATEMKRALAEK